MRTPIIALALAAAGWMAPGPARAQQLVPCAVEGGFCRVPYPTRVIYGAPGRGGTSIDVNGRGIACNNQVFGDPAYGVRKRCAYVALDGGEPRGWDGRDERRGGFERERVGGWRLCARESGYCDFDGVRRVRYGAQGRFVEGRFRDGVSCDNATFGRDPAFGIRKACEVLN